MTSSALTYYTPPKNVFRNVVEHTANSSLDQQMLIDGPTLDDSQLLDWWNDIKRTV